MKPIRGLLAALSVLLMAAPAVAQTNYPDKPVRIIVGFTPGSATDITARLFAQKLGEAWNMPVTVENIPGAGGSVAGDRVAKAAPDGTTLYWGVPVPASAPLSISAASCSRLWRASTSSMCPTAAPSSPT